MKAEEIIHTPRRILVIDDNPRICEDIRKIVNSTSPDALAGDAEFLFGGQSGQPAGLSLDITIDCAQQGEEGLNLVTKSIAEGRPYMLAFVDMRMPPGWDGLDTIQQLWDICPALQIVICTAYSDRPWQEINARLGMSANLLILKKPFDNMEVLQLVQTLTHKWIVTQIAACRMEEMETMVEERTYQMRKAHEELGVQAQQRTEAQQAWSAAEERFQKAFEFTRAALAVLKAGSLEHTEVNASYLELIGYHRPQVIGHTLAELKLADDTSGLGRALAELQAGRPVHNVEIEIRRHPAQKRQALISIAPLPIGNQNFLLFALQDTTDLHVMEAQLRQAQKIESIGQVAGGVAHDFNNILGAVSMHLDLLRLNPNLDPESAASVQEMQAAIQQAVNLTRQLLAFNRPSGPPVHLVDLASVVENQLKMLGRLLGARVNIRFENKTATPPVIRGDPVMVEQVLMNLAINARDAMAGAGVLAVTLRDVEFDGQTAPLHAEGHCGKFIRLSVADTGAGMDEPTQRRIFEPFFTTKPDGKGTGLGLATVFRIVKQHQGWIHVESRLGIGTTFHVFLPAQTENSETGELAPLSPMAGHNEETHAPHVSA